MRNSCLLIKLAGTSNEDKLNRTALPMFLYLFLWLQMKGKKKLLNTKDAVEQKVASGKETKENKPATNKVLRFLHVVSDAFMFVN